MLSPEQQKAAEQKALEAVSAHALLPRDFFKHPTAHAPKPGAAPLPTFASTLHAIDEERFHVYALPLPLLSCPVPPPACS